MSDGPVAVRPRDVPALVGLHARAWQETYPGLLPDADIARMTAPERLHRVWAAVLADPAVRAAWLPGQGFAAMGPQRDARLAAAGHPEELWFLYLLAAAQGRGLGRALMAAVRGPAGFTALVIEGNVRACRFYERQGGTCTERRAETIGAHPVVERVYAWPPGGT